MVLLVKLPVLLVKPCSFAGGIPITNPMVTSFVGLGYLGSNLGESSSLLGDTHIRDQMSRSLIDEIQKHAIH